MLAHTTTTVRLRIADSPVSVAGLSPELAARLQDLMCPFVVVSPGAAPEAADLQVVAVGDERHSTHWIVRLRGEEICTHTQVDALLQYLEWLATTGALAATQRYAAFHGAALTRGPATAMIVGSSGAGKSTLTLNLIQRGWQPLTDDIALMDIASATIQTFPRCFHVEPACVAHSAGHAIFECPAQLPGFARPVQWATGDHVVSALYFVERNATSRSTRTPLTQAQAAGGLLVQVISTGLSPAQIARAAAQLASGARCYRLTNGDLEGALDLITSEDRT